MDEEEDMYAWRSMVRLPASWGEEVDRLARAKALPRAIMVRLLIREGLDQMHREERQKAEREAREKARQREADRL